MKRETRRSEQRQREEVAKKQIVRRGEMQYHSVRSSTIAAIGYVDDSRVLGIMYIASDRGARSTAVYHYQGVPRATFDALMHESRMGHSMGRAVTEMVKRVGYAYVKVVPATKIVADADFSQIETRSAAWTQSNEVLVREMLITAAKFGWRSAHCFDDWGETKSRLLNHLGPRKFSEPRDVAGSVTGRIPRDNATLVERYGAPVPSPRPSMEDAVRDAVLLERERCARVADEEIQRAVSVMQQSISVEGVIAEVSIDTSVTDVSALQRVAAAIRLGDPEKEMEP
jgi:KTSC domain-containing protein